MAEVYATARLHGRGAELSALNSAVATAAEGRRSLVLLEGEAGIGKSRLLAAAVEAARDRGFHAAIGRGEELQQSRPFGVIADALGCTRTTKDALRRPLADLLYPADPAGAATVSSDPSLQFRAVDACVDLVEQLALKQPVLLGLDDLQWADPSSLLVLSAIGQRLAYVSLAVIGCLRPTPRSAALGTITDAFQARGGGGHQPADTLLRSRRRPGGGGDVRHSRTGSARRGGRGGR